MKKILVIAESIDVNATSGAKANVALIQSLVHCKYAVTVLHYTRKEIQIPKVVTCISIEENKTSLYYFLSRAQRVFQRVTKINISRFLENIFGHSFTFFNDSKSITRAISKYYNEHHLIITLSQGASFRPHHAMLCLPNFQKYWLTYVHDPYPFHLYPKPYNWVESGWKQKEDFFKKVSEKAKYSAFPSELLKEWMGKYYPNFLNTGLVIPHQYLNLNQENKLENLSYFNPKKFNVLHAGNLLEQRSPKGLIEGFLNFLESNSQAKPDAVLMLIGPASFHKEFLKKHKDIPQLYIDDKGVPYKEVQFLQQHVCVNVILESEAEISPFLPGKFPHCVFANKPILALGPKHSETKRLLGENYEFQAEINEINKISKLIEKLYYQWKSKQILQLNRPDIEEYLSPAYVGKTLQAK